MDDCIAEAIQGMTASGIPNTVQDYAAVPEDPVPDDVARERETPVIDPTFDAAANLPPVGLGELSSAMAGQGAFRSDVGSSMPTTPRGSRRASSASVPSVPSRDSHPWVLPLFLTVLRHLIPAVWRRRGLLKFQFGTYSNRVRCLHLLLLGHLNL